MLAPMRTHTRMLDLIIQRKKLIDAATCMHSDSPVFYLRALAPFDPNHIGISTIRT